MLIEICKQCKSKLATCGDICNICFDKNKKPMLVVVITSGGLFRSATFDDENITREALYDIIGIKDLNGFRLEKYLEEFYKTNSGFEIEWYESDTR